ncbi:TIGR01212 family radical SAM protein [Bacteroidota bacterium]
MHSWGDDRPYNSFASRIKEKYGSRLQKVSVNAGFTCPNRDGNVATGGCTYCNNASFTPSYCTDQESITSQINNGIEFLKWRYKKLGHFLAYFQSYSNTYDTLDILKERYLTALDHPEISGLVISTRPDCINDDILDYLQLLSEKQHIFLEYGIESCYNETLKKVNRGHSFEQTRTAIELTAERKLHVTGHLLFGLPGETRDMMLNEATIVSSLPLNALKFHQLQVIRNTRMATDYKYNHDQFNLFSLDEYIDFVISFIENLNPDIALERLASESPPGYRISEGFGNKRVDWVQKKIESVMKERNTWQGKKFKK